MELLPKIPSQLLRIALGDMKKTIKQGVRIYMEEWGCDVGTPECSVCFAGSVMLQRGEETYLNALVGETFDFSNSLYSDIKNPNCDQYLFLNFIREGELSSAINQLDIPHLIDKDIVFEDYIPNWKEWEECEPQEFYKQIEDLITYFESINL